MNNLKEEIIIDKLFLLKQEHSYILHRIKDSILTIEGDSYYVIGGIKPFYRLNKENCNEIFGIVDVEKHSNSYLDSRFNIDPVTIHTFERLHKETYAEGFNKATELNKDKVFTLEDMKQALFDLSDVIFNNCQKGISEQDCLNYRNLILKSLQKQQKEIDVEIEQVNQLNIESGKFEWKNKLDENGCIILKKKEYVRS
jgi:hypothetical protein